MKKTTKKAWYKRWWAIVLFIIVGLIILNNILLTYFPSNEEKLKNSLKEDNYEVLDYLCADSWGSVDMKSLGNREEQIMDVLFYLHEYCQNSAKYSIKILEPTKECNYFFNGEIIRLYYNISDRDNFVISEASKKIIEEDSRFTFWKYEAQRAYEFEMKNDPSKMTEYQFMLSFAYKNYLENGITGSTAYSIIYYEIGNPDNCE